MANDGLRGEFNCEQVVDCTCVVCLCSWSEPEVDVTNLSSPVENLIFEVCALNCCQTCSDWLYSQSEYVDRGAHPIEYYIGGSPCCLKNREFVDMLLLQYDEHICSLLAQQKQELRSTKYEYSNCRESKLEVMGQEVHLSSVAGGFQSGVLESENK